MRKILFLCGLLTAMPLVAQTTVVERPTVGVSQNYTNFREPLQQVPLLKLPVGQVQPKGWLRVYLERQRDGLCGQLGTISAWLDKNNNQWLSNAGDHGWEEVPYWLRGYCSLAYILNDTKMKNEARTWFTAALNNLGSDGFLGPKNYEGDNPELWAQMIMLWSLQTYYDMDGQTTATKTRILRAMDNYLKWEGRLDDAKFLNGYWQRLRGGDNLWSAMWVYNRNGNQDLLPIMEKIHRCTSDWCQQGTLPNWHGVNVAQGMREPATWYLYTKDDAHLQATYNNYKVMYERYGQMPGGMYAADENARLGYFDPRNGAETCAIVEMMASDEILMGITGDPVWADHCEEVALNSYTAALMPDMRSLRYITSANMAISDEKLHGPSIDNNLRGMLSMSPFSSRCCQHNHSMGWPYYAEHLVMATTDNGLAAMLYSASETTALVADQQQVRLVEETHYPFDEQVRFTLHTEQPVAFPLYLRIPAWAEGASVLVNGEAQPVADAAGRYVCIQRQWKEGDQVDLTLPMSLRTRSWGQNKGAVSLHYGALALSLHIDTDVEAHDSRDKEFVQDDSHWQAGVDASLWPCYVLRARSKWNYAMGFDSQLMPEGFSVSRGEWPANDFPWEEQSSPLTFTATGYEIPSWGMDATGMTDLLPTKWAARSAEPTPLRLVPMGTARLRIAAFPRK